MLNSASQPLSKLTAAKPSAAKLRHVLGSLVAGASLLTLGALAVPDEAAAQRGHGARAGHAGHAGHAGGRMAMSGAGYNRGAIYSGARYSGAYSGMRYSGARYYGGTRYYGAGYGGYPYRRQYGWNPAYALTAGLLGLGVGLTAPYSYGYGPYYAYSDYAPAYPADYYGSAGQANYYGAAGGCALRSRVVINRYGEARRVVRRVCY